MLAPWKKSYDKPRHVIKQRHYLADKGPSSKAMAFPVVMYGCESWTTNKAECQRIDTFELWCWRSLLSPLNCKEIKAVSPKGNWKDWCWTEAPILWPPDSKNWLLRKDSDAGKDQRQEEKGMTEDEMVGWHHRLNGHEFEQAAGDGEGQGSLACCSPWGCKELDTAEQLNNITLTLGNSDINDLQTTLYETRILT